MITVKEAAKRLKLSEMRVRHLLQEGRIKGVEKFGNAWVIPEKIVIDPPLKVQHRRSKKTASSR